MILGTPFAPQPYLTKKQTYNMKKLILIAGLAVAFSFGAAAQDDRIAQPADGRVVVPDNAREDFMKKHPDAADSRWEKIGDNYEVYYMVDNMERRVVYDPSGKTVRSISHVEHTALPDAAVQHVVTTYNARPTRVMQVTDTNGIVTYETLVGDRIVIYDKEGKYMKELNQQLKEERKEMHQEMKEQRKEMKDDQKEMKKDIKEDRQ